MVKQKKRVLFKYSKFRSLGVYIKGKTKVDYHIEVIFAQIGTGKSTDIAKQSFIELYQKKRYKHVYSNIPLAIPGVRVFNIDDWKTGNFVFPEESIIFVDEVSLIFDNRSWKNFPKKVAEYLRLTRHYKNTFIFYSQHYDCEKTIRTLASHLWLMRRYGPLCVKRRIRKVIVVNDNASGNNGAAESQIMDSLKFDTIFTGLKFTFIPFYVSLFNSFSLSDEIKIPIPYQSLALDKFIQPKKKGFKRG